MYHFVIEDPNQGLREVGEALLRLGAKSASRNGDVIRFTRPTVLEYPTPQRRILDWDVRDANHFFHHFETMWMFAGMDELEPLLLFNSQMAQYSDDGKILRGTAYGKRWFSHFGVDQINMVASRLRSDPTDRRAVLTMWDVRDLTTGTSDFACNMQVIFSVRDENVLDMTVTNRSNDLIYGSMGSNLFHFSMLLELMAALTGLKVGTYYQFSANLHVYTGNPTAQRVLEAVSGGVAPPASPPADTALYELVRRAKDLYLPFDSDQFRRLVEWRPRVDSESAYITRVARPMAEAYRLFKHGSLLPKEATSPKSARLEIAHDIVAGIPSPLGKAGAEWLDRRMSSVR